LTDFIIDTAGAAPVLTGIATANGSNRSDDDKTSAVHFLRFELNGEQKNALKAGAAMAAGIDHKNCRVEIRPLAEIIRQSLVKDLD
jgi:hypothetical protein